MHWIDVKYKEIESAQKEQQARDSERAREQLDRLAVAAQAWKPMADMLTADIEQYNAHPQTKKRAGIRVMDSPKLIEVYWEGQTRVLLHISPKEGEPYFEYGALSLRGSGGAHYGGKIIPSSGNGFTFTKPNGQSTGDAAKLSEELLSPVLFS